jgi:hypothetical protein
MDQSNLLSYEEAVKHLKQGALVSRLKWPSQSFLFKGVGNTVSKDYIPNFKSFPPSVIQFFLARGKDIVFKDSFDLVDGNGEVTRGYSPYTADMMADDWFLF